PSAGAGGGGLSAATRASGATGLLGFPLRLTFRLLPRASPLFRLAFADLRDAIADGHFEAFPRPGGIVEPLHRHAAKALTHGAFDGLQIPLLGGGDQGVGVARRLGACSAAHPVNVILRLTW